VAKEHLVLQGRFKLIRHLGGGGMSEVFLAEQLSLGRLVALKVLKRDLGKQPGMAERFRREALLLSSVDHPAVVRVIDYESAPEGTVLVLEYAEGETLDHALRHGPMEPRRAIRLLTQLADGLASIHHHGIVHRDLKPQNVVLTQTPRGEQARLLDFGIARLLEIPEDDTPVGPAPTNRDNPFVSHPGQAVGTPAYVAPEQAMAEDMDARTDVYSFGVLAFRILAGRLPFEGPETEDYLRQHVREDPPQLSELAPQLAEWPELTKLVMRCLEKKPDDRPASAQEAADVLHRLAGAPVDPEPLAQTARALGAFTTQTWNTVSSTAGSVGQAGLSSVRRARRFVGALSPEWKRSLAITLALVAALPATAALWPKPVPDTIARLLREGKTGDAMDLIDQALPNARGDVPRLLALKAAVLHRQGRADAERQLLRTAGHQVMGTVEPLVLEALAEDFADAEGDAELKHFLELPPRAWIDPTLDRFANGPLSRRQWGALRFLDLTGRARPRDLARQYAASLNSKSCPVRSRAAVRLGELARPEAITALRALSESPKDETKDGTVNCGQDEAAEAIRQLRKHGG